MQKRKNNFICIEKNSDHVRVPFFIRAILIILLFSFSACSSGSSGSGDSVGGCDGACSHESLLVSDVERILLQAVSQAEAANVSANIAVLDRLGNVLAFYKMKDSVSVTRINGKIGAVGGLEGSLVPAGLAAISKAGTGAFLSSQGNAFTTRTASQIIQQHFNPGEQQQPGGPLFGVQFSQLICSDVTILGPGMIGPRPLPLGLSADPGGIPLYKNGDLVGGVGVEVDGEYSLDINILDFDDPVEERIALAASVGFEAPPDRRANRIFVLGKSLRFTDVRYDQLDPLPEIAGTLDEKSLTPIPGFFSGKIRNGVTFGTVSSGVANTERAGLPVSILVDSFGNERFPLSDGSSLPGGVQLKSREVNAILNSALVTAFRSRAAIRRPLDTPARVSIWVVDHLGRPLGFIRSQDAPLFGIDVSLQKARSAVFFSSNDAGILIEQAGMTDYVTRAKDLLGSQVLSGLNAFGDRSIGNISRPFFPDGIQSNAPGPFSLPFPGTVHASGRSGTWSPFNTGLQLDISLASILAPLSGVIPGDCASPVFQGRLKNGVQIFPGAVPLYRDGILIGGIGVSGDGIDQDDLVSFFGASRVGLDQIGETEIGDKVLGFNAPREIRADKIDVNFRNIRLRYVNCPEAPFIGDSSQNVCDNL
ncbi:MAG TPA: heme-binding protein [Oligoflexia bacterium]|nr:heme-binding protein [Oligoflexia bacterium]HMP47531.1 heme-binding protein [Oligoflexia bacterium]